MPEKNIIKYSPAKNGELKSASKVISSEVNPSDDVHKAPSDTSNKDTPRKSLITLNIPDSFEELIMELSHSDSSSQASSRSSSESSRIAHDRKDKLKPSDPQMYAKDQDPYSRGRKPVASVQPDSKSDIPSDKHNYGQ